MRGENAFTQRRIAYNLCCRGGRISLPPNRPWPPPLNDLVSFSGGPASNRFMRLIRDYNALFAFTSLGVHVDRSINTGTGPYVFRINGVVHHRIGSLLPADGNRPEYAQLYIYDTQNEVRNRLAIFERDGGHREQPDPSIVEALITMLDTHNPLVRQFRMARDRLLSPNAPEIYIQLIGSDPSHSNRYTLPSSPELAALIVGDFPTDVSTFDIVVQTQAGEFKSISPLHPALMSLQYPLLFPYGDKGFHLGIKFAESEEHRLTVREDVSMLEFYRYYLHYRMHEPNPFTCSGRLSDQLIVNSFSCVEANRLSFYTFNQDKLRTDTYQGITDAVTRGAETGKDIGIKMILPASFTGSRRYMIQNYHDSMALCRAYGAPDLFSTFTCNPKWPEILEALRHEPGQCPSDRSDIIARVYHMKLQEYLADIKDGTAYGPIRAGNPPLVT